MTEERKPTAPSQDNNDESVNSDAEASETTEATSEESTTSVSDTSKDTPKEQKASSKEAESSASTTTSEPDNNDVSTNSQEMAFFDGEVKDPETLQLELDELEREMLWENQEDVIISPLWKPLIPLFLAVASAVLMNFFQDELWFSLTTDKPIEMGSLVNGCKPDFYKKLKHNRVIKVTGVIPQPNLTAEARVHFAKRFYVVALGCDLLVSLNEKRYRKLVKAKTIKKRPARELKIPENLRRRLGLQATVIVRSPDEMSDTKLVISGRVVRASRSSTADNLRRFYAVTESMPFTPRTHILFDGERPRDLWWALVGYFLLSSFFLYNVWRFLKEARTNWLNRTKDDDDTSEEATEEQTATS